MQHSTACKGRPPAQLRVLLIDDDEDELALLRDIASRVPGWDIQCSWVSTPEAGYAEVRDGEPDLVLLDYHLGEHNGVDLLESLVKARSGCAVVLLTQSLQPSLAELASERGAFAVHDKGDLGPDLLGKLIASVHSRDRAPIELLPPPAKPDDDGPDIAQVAGLGAIRLHDGRVVDADARACALLRCTREDLLGADLSARLWSIDEGGSRPDDWFLVDPDDPSSAVAISRDHDVVAVRDASADYERSLLLEATWREMQAFAYGASHELQAPLRKIAMFTEALARVQNLDERSADLAARAVRSARQMADMLDALLQFSRAGNRQRPLELGPVDLRAVTLEALDECGLMAQEGAAVELSVRGTAHAEADALRKVLVAVLGNAVRFVVPGTSPRVRVTTQSGDGLVHLIVSDEGIGFDMDHAERVFHPYARLCGRSQYPTSNGLGLSTARRWLARMDGEISVDRAAENAGATFRISLRQVVG